MDFGLAFFICIDFGKWNKTPALADCNPLAERETQRPNQSLLSVNMHALLKWSSDKLRNVFIIQSYKVELFVRKSHTLSLVKDGAWKTNIPVDAVWPAYAGDSQTQKFDTSGFGLNFQIA